MELQSKIELLAQRVEGLLRGGGCSGAVDKVAESKQECLNLLEWLRLESTELSLEQLEQDCVKNILKSAIRLHNKSRNLTASSHQDLKNLIKMNCALIMTRASEKKNKVLAVAIKILSKAGQEMMSSDLPPEVILSCLSAATATWQQACEAMIQRELPAIDLQDLSIAAFWAYCNKGSFLYEVNKRIESARSEYAHASALVLSLPNQLKLAFTECILVLCRKVVSSHDNTGTNLVAMLEMGLNHIESVLLDQSSKLENADADAEESDLRADNIQDIRCQVLMSLVFSHLRNKSIEKAANYLRAVEESSVLMRENDGSACIPVITFAKLLLQLEEKSFTDAAETIIILLRSEKTSPEIAIEALKKYCIELQTNGVAETPIFFFNALKFYQIAIDRYCKVAQLSVDALKSIFGFLLDPTETDSDVYTATLQLAMQVVQKCCNGTICADESQFCRIRDILADRIRWYRNSQQWSALLQWGEVLMPLLKSRSCDADKELSLSLIIIDGMIHTARMNEASEIAEQLHIRINNLRTLLMLFKVHLHTDRPVEKCIDILEILCKLRDHPQQRSLNTDVDNLRKYISCARIAAQALSVSKERRDDAISLLLSHWLHLYKERKMWQFDCFDSKIDGKMIRFSFLAVICEKLNRTLGEIMYCSEVSTQHQLPPLTSSSVGLSITRVQQESQTDVCNVLEESKVGDSSFIIIGYPDCIIGSSNGIERSFGFKCSVCHLQNYVVQVTEFAANTVSEVVQQEKSFDGIGSPSEFAWLVGVTWNVATLISSKHTRFSNTGDLSHKLLLAARLYECNAKVLSANSFEQTGLDHNIQISKALIRATNARIDVCGEIGDCYSGGVTVLASPKLIEIDSTDEYSERSGDDLHSSSTCDDLKVDCKSFLEKNLSQALKNVRFARSKLNAAVPNESSCETNSEKTLELATLIRQEMLILCLLGDNKGYMDFLKVYQTNILLLSPDELKLLAEVAHASDGICKDAVYQLLCYALQSSSRSQCQGTGEDLLGSIYQQLIVMSITRQQALEKVEEFEQLVKKNVNGTFNTANIDKIASTAYNYGVALVDLDQLNMAERLVGKSISLVEFGSPSIKEWLPRMQETYLHILQAKENAEKYPCSIPERHLLNSNASGEQSTNNTSFGKHTDANADNHPQVKRRKVDLPAKDAFLDIEALN